MTPRRCFLLIQPAAGVVRLAQLPAHSLGEANAADIHVTPNGTFLHASERQTSTLIGFRIDTRLLAPIGRWGTETTPRDFAIDPRGRFLSRPGWIRTG